MGLYFLKKCKCKSRPDYHRDDCILYDVYGNPKDKKTVLESLLNQKVKEQIDSNIPFYFKLNFHSSFFKAVMIDSNEDSSLPVDFKEFELYFGDRLNNITEEIFNITGEMITFD